MGGKDVNRYEFSAARAVFYLVQEAERDRRENAVTHYGFYHSFICADVKNQGFALLRGMSIACI